MNETPVLSEPAPNGAFTPSWSTVPGKQDSLAEAGIGEQSASFVLGNSAVIRDVLQQVRRFASCDAPVLITGESGTGKELVARAVHDHSRRREEQFVAVNCAAVPASLIASELFGYERGAFTGATTRKRGLIEHAHRGTLFLDEIGDMPIDLQGHLLRFLQEGEIVRVGGHDPIKIDVRVIAATNARLREAIAAGKLREDLFYRLNVLGLHLPPLRERHGDVEVLANHFLQVITRELGGGVRSFSADAIAALQAYTWPGNVRELIATIRRAVILSNSDQIRAADLRLDPDIAACVAPLHFQPSAAVAPNRPPPGSSSERQLLIQTLQRSRYNITRTAKELKVSRVTLYRMLQRNHISLRQECVVEDMETPTPYAPQSS